MSVRHFCNKMWNTTRFAIGALRCCDSGGLRDRLTQAGCRARQCGRVTRRAAGAGAAPQPCSSAGGPLGDGAAGAHAAGERAGHGSGVCSADRDGRGSGSRVARTALLTMRPQRSPAHAALAVQTFLLSDVSEVYLQLIKPALHGKGGSAADAHSAREVRALRLSPAPAGTHCAAATLTATAAAGAVHLLGPHAACGASVHALHHGGAVAAPAGGGGQADGGAMGAALPGCATHKLCCRSAQA